jgi:multidrug resistance efflux pump
MFHKFLLPLLSVAAFAFAIFYVTGAHRADPPAAPSVATAAKPPATEIAGCGVVEPKTQNVFIAPAVPGVVTWVIDQKRIGTDVAEGEGLFKLDDRALKAEEIMRKASLDSARAQLRRLEQMPRPEELPSLRAKVEEAKANVADQEDQWARIQRLFNRKAASTEDVQRRRFALSVFREQLRRAEADLKLSLAGSWKPDLIVAARAVDLAEAQLKQTRVELERLVVTSPMKAKLLQLNIHEGEFVGAMPGQNLVQLGNIEDIYVRVDIDEFDVPRFKEHSPAKAYVRGQPEHTYQLDYVRLEPYVIPKKSLAGSNTERVDTRVLQVIYRFRDKPDQQHPVYIGQQMDVFMEAPPAGPPARES